VLQRPLNQAQLKRLKLEAIDFYHIWCVITLEEWHERKRNGVIETFQKLKEEGLIRHICASSHLIGEEIQELLREDAIEGILFGYNVFNQPLREKAFEEIRRRNLGCVVMNPLGGGIIPQNPDLFEFVKTRDDETVVEAALHFILAHNDIDAALIGFGNKQEVRDALKAVENYKEIREEVLERIKSQAAGEFADLCTGCRYCDNCPEKIPVPKFMDAYNYLKLYGTQKAMLDRLRWHWDLRPDIADKCTECGLCEEACTQHLPIISRLKEIVESAKKKSGK